MSIDADAGILRRLRFSIQFGFFLIGIVTVLLGQILPILSTRLSLNDAQAGILFLAQFSGSLCGTLVSGKFIRRFGFVTSLTIGFVLIIIGIQGLIFTNFFICWLAIFVYGFGLGVAIPITNLLIIKITSLTRQTAAVNFVNFCWGLGAICSPLFVAAFAVDDSLLMPALLLEGLMLIVCIMLVTMPRDIVPKQDLSNPLEGFTDSIWNQPVAWLIVAFNFLHIGIESGLWGWLTTYSQRLAVESSVWTNAATIFFVFLVIGRGLASIISRWLSENRLLFFCLAMLLAGIILILIAGNPLISLLGAAVAGLGSSAIFPTNMSRFAKIFGEAATQRATPLFVAGGLGAALTSSLIGLVSARYNSLETGMFVVLFSVVMLIAIQIFLANNSNFGKS
jgi:fucose permease